MYLWLRLFVILSIVFSATEQASATDFAFKQAIVEASADDTDVAEFYKSRGFSSVWTGESSTELKRRAALINAVRSAADHGLPVQRYSTATFELLLSESESSRDRGLLEVEMTRIFLRYARDVQTGVLVPSRIDDSLVRQVPYRDRENYLNDLVSAPPNAVFRSLPPQTSQYNALMKQKLLLERSIGRGGWGAAVKARKLQAGDSGREVVNLRDRLVRMGYLKQTPSKSFDAEMTSAVLAFQRDHGLMEDGVVGAGTLAEINVPASTRLQSVIVAMERERWTNMERGERHIEVNLADFSAKVRDHGKITFKTRAVVGHRDRDRQSPEFSDVMEFMVVNPSWHVPRSIVTKEYLPQLQQDPYAVGHLEIKDRRGRVVDRSAVDFTQFTSRSFPFAMRQPPSQRNALGLVKFMFPNEHNIYLHDTPAKNLFGREVRAYSHGCIRLADPFDFAYTLLAAQSDDPEGAFKRVLATGKETQINLVEPVPVHIMYRTAVADGKGRVGYRRDVYGRDAKIWDALSQAGVELQAVQG